jgi:AraC family transcriptional regulator
MIGPYDLRISAIPFPPSAGVMYPIGASWGPRVLNDFEFVWMHQGTATYRRGEESIVVPEGAVLLCRPAVEDFFQWDTRRPTRHGFVHFTIHALPATFPPVSSWPTLCPPEAALTLISILNRVPQRLAVGDDAGAVLALADALHEFAHPKPALPPGASSAVMRRLVELIEQEFNRDLAGDLPIDALADALHMSTQHLWRLCKAHLGLSPAELVRRLRFERAALLLLRTNYSVAKVSELCGFEHPSHFVSRFKKLLGRTPGDFRERPFAGNLKATLLPGMAK